MQPSNVRARLPDDGMHRRTSRRLPRRKPATGSRYGVLSSSLTLPNTAQLGMQVGRSRNRRLQLCCARIDGTSYHLTQEVERITHTASRRGLPRPSCTFTRTTVASLGHLEKVK